MYEHVNNDHATKDVREAIANTEELLDRYFSTTIGTRTDVGIGSTYDNMSPEALREHLKKAQWEEVFHKDVMPGCKAYVTKNIPGGRMGLLNVKDLPDDTLFLAEDPKSTGRVSICTAGELGHETKETFIIVGKDTDQPNPADRERPVVFTFHPGEPVRPSLVNTAKIADGSILTKSEVLGLGFDLAKVDKRAEEKIVEKMLEEHPTPETICSALEKSPYYLKYVDGIQGVESILDRSPEAANAYDEASFSLFDKLQDQGLVFADDHTLVFFVPDGEPEKKAIEALGFKNEDSIIIAYVDRGGMSFEIKTGESGLATVESFKEMKNVVENMIIDREGFTMERYKAINDMKKDFDKIADQKDISTEEHDKGNANDLR